LSDEHPGDDREVKLQQKTALSRFKPAVRSRTQLLVKPYRPPSRLRFYLHTLARSWKPPAKTEARRRLSGASSLLRVVLGLA
jgi:hypothetical protein